MDSSFTAIVARDFDKRADLVKLNTEAFFKRVPGIEDRLFGSFMGRQVIIKVHYSTLNYKDALAITTAKRVISKVPLILGVDLAAEVIEVNSASKKPKFEVGDLVVANGYGLGEKYNGGLSEMSALNMSCGIKLSEIKAIEDLRKAMSLGTAGLTAMLCVSQVISSTQKSYLKKIKYPVAVTGATGGVGLLSIHLLKNLGFKVVAITDFDPKKEALLKRYGVDDIIDVKSYITEKKTLKSQRFLGAVDVVGGSVLAELLKDVAYYGCVASTGMALSDMFTSSLYPFIIRGVRLAGIESIMTPMRQRRLAFKRLFQSVDFKLLADDVIDIDLKSVPVYAQKLVDNTILGRIVVKCQV